MRFATLVGIFVLVASTFATNGVVSAQSYDPAAYIRQLHQRYIGRDPSSEESRYWLDQLSRGATANDAHAGVLGSEAYFNRHKRDPAAWVDGAFAMVQNRTPSEAERSAWLTRLSQLGNDRIAWAKEFLTASGASVPSVGTPYPSGGDAATLADRLVTTTRLLSDATETELPGTRNWLVKVQATNLEASAASYRSVLSDPARDPSGAASAQQNLARSVDSLRTALNSAQVNAPSSRLYLSQSDELVQTIGRNLSGGSVAKPPVSPIVTGYDAATVAHIDQHLADLASKSQQTALLSRTGGLRDYEYVRLQNDLDAFAAQCDSARLKLRTNVSRADVQANLISLRTQGSVVTSDLQRVNVDARVTTAWYQTVQELDATLAAAGVTGGIVPSIPPTQPGGGWNDPTGTDWAASQRIRDAVAAVQAECDALSVAYAPYAIYSFHIQSLQEELRSLRSAMDAVNLTANSSGSAQDLWERIAESNGDYSQAKSYWKKAQASQGLQNLPALDRLSLALSRLNAAAAGR